MLERLVRLLPVENPAPPPWPVVAIVANNLRLVVGDIADRDGVSALAARSFGGRSATLSRSAAAGRCVVLAGSDGRIGLDVETIARVELNATAHDRWLATSERALVGAATDQTLELACHWVLKEAYGKALGVGLALPLSRLAFGCRAGAVVLAGSAAPRRAEGWSFGLYRYADLIVGIAHRPQVQAGIPLAPAGRKPPMPLLDR